MFGQSATFTATISGGGPTPGGTVEFWDGSTELATASLNSSGVAAYSTSALSVGNHFISTIYDGDSNYYGTGGGYLSQTVNKADTTVLLTPSANGLAPGQPVSFTANVSAATPGAGTPSGTVTFYNGMMSPLGTATLSGGKATLAVSPGFTAGTYAISAHYNGDSDFNTATSANLSLVVANPNPVAGSVGTASNCGCPDQPGTVNQAAAAATGNVPSAVSSNPVRYADGVAQLASTDLSGAGLGTPWAQTRSWTNGPGYAADGVNGVGWVGTQMPYLMQINGTTTVAAISNGMTAECFDLVSGSYQARYFDQSTLVHDTTANQYVLTDETGNQLRFYDFTTAWGAGQQGQFASGTDPDGNVTAATSHNSAGRITEVQRSGGSVVESWLYTYLGGGDPNAGLLGLALLALTATSRCHTMAAVAAEVLGPRHTPCSRTHWRVLTNRMSQADCVRSVRRVETLRSGNDCFEVGRSILGRDQMVLRKNAVRRMCGIEVSRERPRGARDETVLR